MEEVIRTRKVALDPGIPYRIWDIRDKCGYSREKFAECIDMSARNMCGFENGNQDLLVSNLIKMCDALNVSPNYILYGEQDTANEILFLLRECNEKQLRTIKTIITAYLKSDNEA